MEADITVIVLLAWGVGMGAGGGTPVVAATPTLPTTGAGQ